MNFLKNHDAWKRWARKCDRYQGAKLEAPKEYPCYGYLVVGSFNYEEEAAAYLYPSEIIRMAKKVSPQKL